MSKVIKFEEINVISLKAQDVVASNGKRAYCKNCQSQFSDIQLDLLLYQLGKIMKTLSKSTIWATVEMSWLLTNRYALYELHFFPFHTNRSFQNVTQWAFNNNASFVVRV